MSSRLAQERPRSFAGLVILVRDRVLAGTDLPQAARITLMEAFAAAKSSQALKVCLESHSKNVYVRRKGCLTLVFPVKLFGRDSLLEGDSWIRSISVVDSSLFLPGLHAMFNLIKTLDLNYLV